MLAVVVRCLEPRNPSWASRPCCFGPRQY